MKQTYSKPESRMIQPQIEPVIEEELPNYEIKHKDNPVKLVKEEPISTFSVDIDDGSYKLFKEYVNRGNLIDKKRGDALIIRYVLFFVVRKLLENELANNNHLPKISKNIKFKI